MNEFFPKFFKTNYKNNILVNTLQIGLTDTKLAFKDKSKNLKKRISLIPINRMAKTKEVTNYIYQLFQEKNSLLTNQILNISGGE
jgi:NAD(P)-dependent dehydrogenase (short-subunit alcohol dehydrogenase family)